MLFIIMLLRDACRKIRNLILSIILQRSLWHSLFIMKVRKWGTDNSKTKEFEEEILLKFGGEKNPHFGVWMAVH